MFRFGQLLVDARQVFYYSKFSLALVNLKPVLKGHVLIIPRRVVKRFSDLKSEEINDLFLSSQHICSKLQAFYNASAMSYAIQDGLEAGQTVQHVHLHCIPRKTEEVLPFRKQEGAGAHVAVGTHERDYRPPRTMEDMAAEAQQLQQLFPENTEAIYGPPHQGQD